MVIQSHEIKTSSQRTFLSVESTNMLATREIRIPQNVNVSQQTPQAPGMNEEILQLERRHGRHHRRGGEDGHFRRMHRESVDERIRELARKLTSSTQGVSSRRAQRRGPPRTPQELKAELLRMMIELLTGKNSKSSKTTEKADNETERRGFDLSSLLAVESVVFRHGLNSLMVGVSSIFNLNPNRYHIRHKELLKPQTAER